MAEWTPKLLASYEAAQTTDRLPFPGDDHWLAAQLRIVALLDRCVKRVHIDMDDFSHDHSAIQTNRLL